MANTEITTRSVSRTASRLDLLLLSLGALVVAALSVRFDLMERLAAFVKAHERWELDEVIVVSLFLMAAAGLYSYRRWRELEIAREALRRRHADLLRALTEIRQLRGILPICSCCKKIRNEQGDWLAIELYLTQHTEAKFSHSFCPVCEERLSDEVDHLLGPSTASE